MFLWIGKKGVMRGPVWFLFLLGSFAGIIGGIGMLATYGIGDGGGPKSLSFFSTRHRFR